MPRQDLATVLAEVALKMNAPATLSGTLQAIVDAACVSIPGIGHAGVSVAHRGGRMETLAASDELTLRLDELQYGLGEGPCVYAMEGHGIVSVSDATTDDRWPAYMPRAVAAGLRAQVGIELFLNDRAMGGLNLYSTSGPLDPDAAPTARLFAAHAAVAFGRARTETQLRTAVESRTVVGQATGMLMQRYDLSSERAFEFLARVSSHRNVKLIEVARELITSGVLPESVLD